MDIPCRRCRTLNPLTEAATVVCVLCGARTEVTAAQRRRAERAGEREERRRALHPFNVAASIGMVAVTLVLLFGMFGRYWSGTPFAEATFWAFPVWSTLLFVGAIFLARHDREGLFPVLRRSTAVVLGVLLLPVLWEALPRRVRTGEFAQATVQRISQR